MASIVSRVKELHGNLSKATDSKKRKVLANRIKGHRRIRALQIKRAANVSPATRTLRNGMAH